MNVYPRSASVWRRVLVAKRRPRPRPFSWRAFGGRGLKGLSFTDGLSARLRFHGDTTFLSLQEGGDREHQDKSDLGAATASSCCRTTCSRAAAEQEQTHLDNKGLRGERWVIRFVQNINFSNWKKRFENENQFRHWKKCFETEKRFDTEKRIEMKKKRFEN